jgi:hypothetical protein
MKQNPLTDWQLLEPRDGRWLAVEVPGCVLQRHGRISNPFLGRKSGKPIAVGWQFYHASVMDLTLNHDKGRERTGLITPPSLGDYEIASACTEVWLEQAADRWVAVGSDDHSKVWLNNQLRGGFSCGIALHNPAST